MKSGTWVLLRDTKETAHVVQVPQAGGPPVAVGKLPAIPNSLLLAAEYYWVLELDKSTSTWRRVPEEEYHLWRQANDDVAPEDAECLEDNRALEDSGENQALSATAVEEMKAQGVTTKEMIAALTEGSATFNSKTKLAQLKWLRKKEKKHLAQVEILPVSIMTLCEKYADNEFKRIAGLRWDYISTMVNTSAIRPGMRVVVVDQGMGLLTAAVLRRLHGSGCLLRVGGDQLSSRAMDFFNFSPEITSVIHDVPFDLFDATLDLESSSCFDDETNPINEHRWIKPPRDLSSAPEMIKNREKMHCSPDPDDAEFREQQQRQYRERQRTRAAVLQLLLDHGVHAVLGVVSTLKCPGPDSHDSKNMLVKAAKRILRPDGKFSLFSLNHAVVLAGHLELQEQGDFTAGKFQELFLREIQVLPLRTHPLMSVSERLYSGYLTSAIKVGL